MTTGVVAPDEKTFLELARDPPGGAGDPPAARRRRDAGRGLPQAGRRPGHLPAGVGRARRGLGRHRVEPVLVHRRAQHRHPDRARRAGRTGSARRRPACRPAGDPVERAAGDRAAADQRRPARRPGSALPPLTGGLVGFLSYDIVRRFERLPELSTDDLHVPELGHGARHRPGGAGPLRGLGHRWWPTRSCRRRPTKAAACAAYHQAIGRLDAMTTALSRPTPPMVSTVEQSGRRAVRLPYPRGAAPQGGGGGQGGHPRRRVLPDRGGPALRAAHRRRPARHLPGAALDQPEPVHVPAPVRRLRHRRLLARGAPEGDRPPGPAAPDRRHPVARGDAGGGRPARRRAARPTRRSGPST